MLEELQLIHFGLPGLTPWYLMARYYVRWLMQKDEGVGGEAVPL